MIDVIIPAYNAHDTIEQTLCSIAYQSITELINVYIVDDCSEKDYSEVVSFFGHFLNIKLMRLQQNSGPGVARQYGIDHSNSEYIIFIDADDVFADSFAVKTLYECIEKDNSDLVIGNFTEETSDAFRDHLDDTTWLHGKIYRRSFLEKNHIRFNETRANEDNGFNQLVLLCNPDIKYIKEKVYIWRNNTNSITRSNNYQYRLHGLEGFAYNINYALEEGLKRNCNLESFSKLAYSTIVSEYYYYLRYYDNEKINGMLKLAKHTLELYNMHPIDKKTQIELMKDGLNSFMSDEEYVNYILRPVITFDNFIELLKGLGE